MIDLEAIEWDALRRDESFRRRLVRFEEQRHEWIPANRSALAAGIAVALVFFYVLLPGDGFPVEASVVAVPILALTLFGWRGHYRGIERDSVDPWLLGTLTERADMLFVRDYFTPPGLGAAEPFLFERPLKSVDGEYLAATAESELAACATCRVEKALKGRIYRIRPARRNEQKRVAEVRGPITLVLPRGADFMPMRQGVLFERLLIDDDPAFTAAFDVHAIRPDRARVLLGPALRALLIEISEGGETRAFFQGEQALVFAPDPLKRIESPDDRPVEDYVREMVDAFRSVLMRLDRLRALVPRDEP